MLVELHKDEAQCIAWLLSQDAFQTFLRWIERSREHTNEQIYESADDRTSHVLIGGARDLDQVAKKCREAPALASRTANPPPRETIGGEL